MTGVGISQSCAYTHQVLLQCVANRGCTAGGHEQTPAACSQQEAAVEDACEQGGSGSTG